jgi:hypothetical protein
MIFLFKDILRGITLFLRDKGKRRLIYLFLLGGIACAEFAYSGLVRRTFVFYSGIDGTMVVENRMLPHSPSREIDIRRYAEEVLLGPVSPDSAFLFPQETRLRSLLYRDGVVYADLSESAALPSLEGGDVFQNLYTLQRGIRRNFSFVEDVKLFIAGHEVQIASPGP